MKNDFGKLEHWAKLFREGQVLLAADNSAMAQEMLKRVKVGFNTETDPYGKRWAPKKRPDGRKVLHGKTGRLKGGWRVRKLSKTRGFTLIPSVDYAAPHQAPRHGSRPRRMMVPAKGRGIPATWKAALHRIADKNARAYYSGRLKSK